MSGEEKEREASLAATWQMGVSPGRRGEAEAMICCLRDCSSSRPDGRHIDLAGRVVVGSLKAGRGEHRELFNRPREATCQLGRGEPLDGEARREG